MALWCLYSVPNYFGQQYKSSSYTPQRWGWPFESEKMFGTLSAEMEVKVAASAAWDVYGTLRLSQILFEQHSGIYEKLDVLEGDGGAGTVLDITFRPGATDFSHYKEKFTVVDDEKRVKVGEGIEGGYLDHGLDLYRVRFEIIEKQRQGEEEEDSCITKATVEFETQDLAAANLAVASIQANMAVMKAAANYLTANKQSGM